MPNASVSLPEDPTELRTFTTMLMAEVKAQAVLIEKLRHQLAGHKHSRYGAKSETIEQLNLALEASEIAVAAMTARFRLASIEPVDKPKRLPIPDHIPRNHIELTTGDDACASCGGNLRKLGEDVTEELEYVPGRFVVNRITRPRFACSGCESFTQAVLPSRPIDRGRPGPGLLAHVLVSKYADRLPLYRQSQIFGRDGLDIDRSTLTDWVGKTTALLEPLADAIGRHVRAGQAIFADDTPVKMLAPGTGKTQTARLWVYARDERPYTHKEGSAVPPAAWYRFSPDRKGQHPKDHLAGYEGWMHADGYTGFEDLYRSRAIREVACMAHACPRAPTRGSGASSLISTVHRDRPLRMRPSPASRSFTPSRRKREARLPIAAESCVRQKPCHCSMISKRGCTPNYQPSPANPRLPLLSATPSHA